LALNKTTLDHLNLPETDGMAEQTDWSIERGLLLADQEIKAFRSAILGKSFTSVAPLTSRTQQVFRAEIGGVLSALRVVSHVKPAASERHTNAFHRLARALSPHRMSSPAVLTRFTDTHSGVPANTDIVVTEYAPPTYIEGNKVTRKVLRRISSEHRHLGAILSYIAHLADHAVKRNLLISTDQNGEFPFWFIDLDFAFGTTMSWGHGKPIFYPDRRLDYQADGDAAPLPTRAAELLEWIDGLPRQEVARVFGLSGAEVNDFQARCSTIRQLGLAAAIERERFWQRTDGLLVRWKERAYAQFAKSLIASRSFRSRERN
jgi:hypothetical protein